MTNITISLSEERLQRLMELANEMNLQPEELARAGLEDWLGQPREDFRKAAQYVLTKNAELYRRLDNCPYTRDELEQFLQESGGQSLKEVWKTLANHDR